MFKLHIYASCRPFQQAKPRSKSTDMYAFGVTLWELFSGHFPYDTDVRPAHELIEELKDLLTDVDDPLRPDLQLVDPRVRPLLQVTSHACVACICICGCEMVLLVAQRCWAMDPEERATAAQACSELEALQIGKDSLQGVRQFEFLPVACALKSCDACNVRLPKLPPPRKRRMMLLPPKRRYAGGGCFD